MRQKAGKILLAILSISSSIFFIDLVLQTLRIPKSLISEWSLHSDYRAPDPNTCLIDPSFYSLVKIKRKEKNERLIITLGDSFTEGYPVQGHGYPEQLQTKLTSLYGSTVQVINFGMGDTGPDQHLRIFKELILPAMKPDIVVWSLYPNDISDNVNYALYTISESHTLQKIDCRTNFLYIRQLINTIPLPNFFKESKMFRLVLKSTEWLIDNKIPKQYKKNPEQWAYYKLELEIDEMNALAKKHNFELYYVLIAPQVVYDHKSDNLSLNKYNMIKRLSNRIGLDNGIIDLNFSTIASDELHDILGTSTDVTTALFAEKTQDVNPQGDRHFNTHGYQVFAA